MSEIIIAQLLLLGVLIGFLTAFIGIGGGIVMVPVLPMLLGMSVAEATATSLFAIFMITVRNTLGFSKKGYVQWRPAMSLGLTAGVFSAATGWVAAGASDLVLRVIYGTMIVGLIVFVNWPKGKSAAQTSGEIRPASMGRWMGLGALCGVLSGGSGIGSGVVAGPILGRLRYVPESQIVPVVNAMMLMNTGSAVAAYMLQRPQWVEGRFGLVWVYAALAIFIGSQISAPFAIQNQHRLSSQIRQRLLIGLLTVVGLQIWWDVYRLWTV